MMIMSMIAAISKRKRLLKSTICLFPFFLHGKKQAHRAVDGDNGAPEKQERLQCFYNGIFVPGEYADHQQHPAPHGHQKPQPWRGLVDPLPVKIGPEKSDKVDTHKTTDIYKKEQVKQYE
jgi:hypothetical protein